MPRGQGTVMKSIPKILIVDDNPEIHADFRKVLCPPADANRQLDELESSLFGAAPAPAAAQYALSCALQGQEAASLARTEIAQGRHFSLAFIDMRMPPGWDGMQTMLELKKIDPSLRFVVCSAYSDYTRAQICQELGWPQDVLFVSKPFDPAEIHAIVGRLTAA